jgi:hypothetical protein
MSGRGDRPFPLEFSPIKFGNPAKRESFPCVARPVGALPIRPIFQEESWDRDELVSSTLKSPQFFEGLMEPSKKGQDFFEGLRVACSTRSFARAGVSFFFATLIFRLCSENTR